LKGTFSEDDRKKLAEFSSALLKHVRWDSIDTKELMKVYGLLMWYNGLDKKIADNLLELKDEGSLDENLDNNIDDNNAASDDVSGDEE